jgi:transposase-like protein
MGAYANQFRPKLHLTVEEAARRFGVSPHTLTAALRRHQLEGKRAAHRSWVTASAVAAFLEKQQTRERADWNTPGHAA